jgi:hypothetical protein
MVSFREARNILRKNSIIKVYVKHPNCLSMFENKKHSYEINLNLIYEIYVRGFVYSEFISWAHVHDNSIKV